MRKDIAAALAAIAVHGAALAEDRPMTSPGQPQEGFADCATPLAAARDRLVARGYALLPAPADEVLTDFKRSEGDTERYLLGSLAVERLRQYRVVSAPGGGIRFSAILRETRHPHSEERNATRTTREYAQEFADASAARVRDMRDEVCGPAPAPGAEGQAATRARRIEDYAARRCQAGDREACEVLRAP